MDERLGQIKEGAGLEESRINAEFVDFLRKWSTPALALLAAAALAYLGMQKLEQRRQDRADTAFREYEAASTSGNPDALIRVASEFGGVGAIKPMALVDAGDIYFGSVLSGIEPGAPLDEKGQPENAEDRLSDDERDTYLGRAEAEYRAALDASGAKPGYELHAISAAYGLAAIAETRGDATAAREWYEKVFEFAGRGGYVPQAEDAEQRILNRAEAIAPVPLNDASVQPAAPVAGLLSSQFGGEVKPVEEIRDAVEGWAGEAPTQGPELPPPAPDAESGSDEPTEPAPPDSQIP